MDYFGDDVLRFAISMTRDLPFAEDVRQDTFVAACRDFDQLEDLGAFPGWIMTIARRRYLDAVKSRKRWDGRIVNEDVDEQTPVDEPRAVERNIELRQLAKVLQDCLDKLDEDIRMSVVLRFGQDLSFERVAAMTKEKSGTVQRRVWRAMAALRKCMKRKLREDHDDV